MNNIDNEIVIYTDGSCHTQFKTGAWAAIILIDEKEEIVLKDMEIDTTHNRMELLSVIKALDYIKEHHFEKYKITVKSDSQYVIGIKNRTKKLTASGFMTKKEEPVQNVDLLKQLISLSNSLNVEFIKVKAHQKKTDIRNYNRVVDKISRKLVRDYVKKNC